MVSDKGRPLIGLVIAVFAIAHLALAADESLASVYETMDPQVVEDDYTMHDPARVISRGGKQMTAVTGKAQEDGYNCGLETWYRDSEFSKWQPGQCLFRSKPSWIFKEIPQQGGAYWAPELVNYKTMYYSVADFTEQSSMTCVGLATASGTFPNKMAWKDSGSAISCADKNDWDFEVSAIDPTFVRKGGRMYLITGGGLIHGTEVNKKTFRPKKGNWFAPGASGWKQLARGPNPESGDDNWVEAAYSYYRRGWFYLFVNWGSCCSGVRSTYNIRIGRSRKALGPYLDKKDVDMMDGGGSLFLKKRRYMIGPGHAGIWKDSKGRHIFTFHYYDKRRGGNSWMAERQIKWGSGGWPKVGKLLSSYKA